MLLSGRLQTPRSVFQVVQSNLLIKRGNSLKRQRSHLVPGYGARVRHSLGTNVNTPFFQVPALELGYKAPVPEDLALGHKSGHRAPVCTQFY